jgi:hypothetical protein
MKALLLNSTYEYIRFISEKKLLKFLSNQNKNKIDILSYWDNEYYSWGSGCAKLPAIVKLKYHRPWIPKRIPFSRKSIFLRDQYLCQYCGDALTKPELEHIIPLSQGGKSSWKNCVTSCRSCNNYKGNRTPEQAGMRLLSEPKIPEDSIISDYWDMTVRHKDWPIYLGITHSGHES